MSKLSAENFCIQPWIHLATWNDGSVPLCCVARPEQGLNLNKITPREAWNSQQFKNARLSFLDNKRIPQCSSCWKEEESGIKSHRIVENNMWEKHLGKEFLENLIESTNSDGSVSFNPMTLDLRLGNTCNLQCVMCRPRDSSKWLSDAKKLSLILTDDAAKADWDHKASSITDTDCFDWFERLDTQNSLDEFIGDIRHIIFGGGEPLLIKEHERFITNLVASGSSKNIKLRYHTNGTQLNEQFINLWSSFKEVELMISLDDWGDRNDYVRYPAKWDIISKNLDRLDETADNIRVSLLTTVHAMNVYNLPDFAMHVLNRKWKKVCNKNDGLFSIGTTHWPQYLSTQTLPTSIKEQIVSKWNSYEELTKHKYWSGRIMHQLSFMLAIDCSDRFPSLMDYIDKLDEIRQVKFKNVYSDYYAILKGELNGINEN